MRNLRERLALTAVTAAALTLTAALALAGTAQAGTGPVQYTHKSANTAVAGYFASAFGVYFTHIGGYIGSDGNSLAQLDPAPDNGAGYGMCNQSTGVAAQIGVVVNPGGATKNIEYSAGIFGAPVNNGDPCQNGNVNPGGAVTLFAGVPIGDTVNVEVLFDGHHAHNGCHARQVLFLAQDITAHNGITRQSPCIWMPFGTVFNEAEAGVTADDTLVAPLPDQAGVQADTEPNMLMREAHVFAAGNGPNGVVHGSILMPNSAWDIYPVASTSNGLAPLGGTVLLAPGVPRSDHFVVKIGGSPA